MKKLWGYEDYIKHLSHENKLVRRWAFKGLENQYFNRFASEVHLLIDDPDEHLACVAPNYLAHHNAVQYAPQILNSFLNSSGNVPGNCARALGKMNYVQAFDQVVRTISQSTNFDTFGGLLDYLGYVHTDDSRQILISAVSDLEDNFILQNALRNLIFHLNTDDIPLIFNTLLSGSMKNYFSNLLKNVLSAMESGYVLPSLYNEYKNVFLKDPEQTINELMVSYPFIRFDGSVRKNLVVLLNAKNYKEFVYLVYHEVSKVILKRYPEETHPEWLESVYRKDIFSLKILEYITANFDRIERKTRTANNFEIIPAAVFTIYCAILERGSYLDGYNPDADIDQLLNAMKNSGPHFPRELQDKIQQLAPVAELKTCLKSPFNLWRDIWAVRLMGKIGSADFVEDLLHVSLGVDSLDYIYEDSLKAIAQLDEYAHNTVLSAIEAGKPQKDGTFYLLEYLPYSRAFDIAVKSWECDDQDIDSYEIYACTLENIGDPRGIQQLQQMYNTTNQADYIGESLECLAEIHGIDIPEMSRIRASRINAEKPGLLSDLFTPRNVPTQRKSPKIGRNDPCPCGSGKKYKKCCLNK